MYSYFKYVIAASGPNYAVTMYTAGGGPQTQLWSGSSINNGMAPDLIEFGLEATNTATQSSDYDYFENNQFSPDGSSWYYFTEGGSPASYNPPYWRWVTVPTPGGTGGFGETKCC